MDLGIIAGIVMLIPAVFLLLLVGKVLDLAVVEVSDTKDRPIAARKKAARQAPQGEVLTRRRKQGGEATQ